MFYLRSPAYLCRMAHSLSDVAAWVGASSTVFETFLVVQGDRGSLVGRGKPSGGFHKRHMVGTLEYLAPEVSSRSAKLDAAFAEQLLGHELP